GGLHGVGISVVNALSDVLEVEVARNQTLYRQTFSRGHAQGALETIGRVQNRRGTRVRFHPDAEIFGEHKFDPRRLFKMARSKAYLFGGVEIRWRCAPALLKGVENVPAEAVHRFPAGLKDYLAREIDGKDLVADGVFAGKVTRPGSHGSLEWAMAWLANDDGFSSSYCNTIPTPEGGTHESGMRVALLRALRDHAERVGQVKRMASVTAEDVMATCAAMLSVFIREPEFQGQTKDKLATLEASRIVEAA
ncbi:DNA topoisomerase IV subunit B, partial [Methylobacterium tarhaniae]